MNRKAKYFPAKHQKHNLHIFAGENISENMLGFSAEL